jgi:hypothetical protein
MLLKIGSQAAIWLWFVVVPQQSLKLARGNVGRQRLTSIRLTPDDPCCSRVDDAIS